MLRDDWRKTWAAYFGLITMVDACIGQVIEALEQRGVWDDALIIFTQDHGEAIGSHRMFQKMTMYEESAHVPLLVKPPGGGRGRRAQCVGHVDLAPTICDFAGARPLSCAWGESLRGPIECADAAWRDVTYLEFNGDHGRGYPSRAVTDGRYKYIFHFCDRDELYDLQADPQETRSLADDPRQQERRHAMRALLARWMRETDDVLDIERDALFTPRQWRNFDRARGWLPHGRHD
jgi:arylsulfatase A-like enzyme